LYVGSEPTSPYDGSTLANSGLLGLGGKPGTFSMTFSKPGRYQYYCVIHPTMVGSLTVSKAADAQAAITARGNQELKQWLAEGRAARKKLASTPPKKQQNTDGTTTWTVEMGASTAHTDVLAFSPTPSQIHAGDQVLFVNNSGAPHTASFGGELVPTNPLSPEVDPPAPGPAPQTLLAGAFYNTGLLPPKTPGGAPKAARSFTFVVTNPGKYEYVCILHLTSGMAGELDAT
jgi:plastocyanin